ncbi:MAG: Fe-S protein assembly co-chaperone HscB [Gammaproteobacteria bacterium]|nr:MAG: Fe-S protein assembly co-chaperone HscB [Gammaproteobacteria bacterium]UCH39217.1 MAG: Fe-S protein assembly co-chaperone HscB [Gammaproteobacteria bacterium]
MQSPELSQNYFELFGLNPVFEIDPTELHARQQRLQATYHPDRHAASSDQQKRLSVQMASWINQAYETLQDPVKRARYLLEINGTSMPDDSATTADGAFLMEQIELREEVEACRHGENGLQRSEDIAERLDQRANDLAREFVDSFGAGKTDAAIEASRKMQFIQRIQQQLAELQFELEDF